jgi:NADH-ubiquinone oxidoreductase chain 2
VGAIGGYNQILIRKILAYSSINHIRWLISSTIIGEKIIIIYFFIYSFLNAIIISITAKWNIRHLSQMPLRKSSKNINSLFITNLLSLGGIPPFLGFLPRWIIVSELITKIPLQISLLTISSLLRLYFYLRITYVIILKSPTQHILLQNSKYNILSAITVLSATALIISVPLL